MLARIITGLRLFHIFRCPLYRCNPLSLQFPFPNFPPALFFAGRSLPSRLPLRAEFPSWCTSRREVRGRCFRLRFIANPSPLETRYWYNPLVEYNFERFSLDSGGGNTAISIRTTSQKSLNSRTEAYRAIDRESLWNFAHNFLRARRSKSLYFPV